VADRWEARVDRCAAGGNDPRNIDLSRVLREVAEELSFGLIVIHELQDPVGGGSYYGISQPASPWTITPQILTGLNLP
jgi:hypothetical protein